VALVLSQVFVKTVGMQFNMLETLLNLTLGFVAGWLVRHVWTNILAPNCPNCNAERFTWRKDAMCIECGWIPKFKQ